MEWYNTRYPSEILHVIVIIRIAAVIVDLPLYTVIICMDVIPF